MFSALNPEELTIVLDAMQHVKKHPGENVIKEGDDGDNLYVLEKGVLHCTKIFVINFIRVHNRLNNFLFLEGTH
jgi:hypothetical protein